MEQPLWTEKHRPTVSDIPQPDAREYLEQASGSALNLLVYGPRGVGKTAAVRALGEASHDNPDADLMIVNAADFFNRTKKEIRNDDRFGHFLQGQTEFSKQYRQSGDKSNKYKRKWSKRDMLSHVLKELAGYESSGSEYKTIVIDNAEAMRGDFQQALRRIIEKHHETTQFILIARSSSGIIPAIQSRCSPLPMESPRQEAVVDILETIADEEEVEYIDDGLEFIAGYSEQNIRKAILSLQTVAGKSDQVTAETAASELQDIGVAGEIEDALEAAENDDIKEGRKTIDSLLIDEGMEGDEVLRRLVEQTQYRYPEELCIPLTEKAADIDMDLSNGSNARVHLTNYLTEVAHAT